jgi:hypothetical protein
MNIKNIAAMGVLAYLTGCAAVPLTSEEFRASVRQEGSHIDSYTANRPFGEVSRTVKKMSDECLNFSMMTVKNGNAQKPWGYANTTFIGSAKQAELRFQRKVPGQIGTYPENGMYFLVADMIPAGAGKTKVDVYYWDNAAPAAKAIRGWASGDMLGCPDPADIF